MPHVSAFRTHRMSISRTHKPLLTGLIVITLMASPGCGSSDPEVNERSTAQTGATATTATAPAGKPEPSAPTSETDLVPVDVALEDGTFASSTPKTIHVPSDFLVLIDVKADDGGPYELSVLSPSSAQTLKIPSNSTQKITQDGLAPGKQIKLMLAGKTVRIVADAEPGP